MGDLTVFLEMLSIKG